MSKCDIVNCEKYAQGKVRAGAIEMAYCEIHKDAVKAWGAALAHALIDFHAEWEKKVHEFVE